MPFLLSEDRALKSKLQGLFVHDATSGTGAGRKVTVRFRNPEHELADFTYPLILLGHTRIGRAEEREHRGHVNLHYVPEGLAPWGPDEDPPYWSQVPIPLDIDYQVDLYARKQVHLIELTGRLLGFDFFTPRFGYLAVPEDGTVRRLDLLGGPEYTESQDTAGKRLFVASWVLRVSAEVFWSEIESLPPALRVLVDFVDHAAWKDGREVPLGDTLVVTEDPLVVTSLALPAARVGVAYRQPLVVSGGTAPCLWSLEGGSTLPEGLSLVPDGLVFGAPSAASTTPATFRVRVSDADYPPHVARAEISIPVIP